MIYYSLGKNIKAFTTDRTVGRDPYLLCPLVGVKPERFARPHQVHEDIVYTISEDFFLLPYAEQREQLEGIDAVITDVTDACIGISTADCIPVLVYDPTHHVAAAIHAGWKGTVKRIVEKSIDEMARKYNTAPSECTAIIGPGIEQVSFEVGQEVVERFKEAGFDIERHTVMMPNTLRGELPEEKPHIDLKEINRQQLLAKGLHEQNITVSPIDTFTDEHYFSARREQKGNIKCGRILTGFVLMHNA